MLYSVPASTAFSVMRTRKGSTISMFATFLSIRMARGFRICGSVPRFQLYRTSSAVKGSPLWKVTPSRSLKFVH